MHVVSRWSCLLVIILLVSTQTQAASVQMYNLYNKYTASDGIASSSQTSLRQAKGIGSAPEKNKKKAEFTSPVDGYFIQVSGCSRAQVRLPHFAMSHWYNACPGACFKGPPSTWTAQEFWCSRALETSPLSLEQRYTLPTFCKPVAYLSEQNLALSACNTTATCTVCQCSKACCTCRHKAALPGTARPGLVQLS